MVRAWAKPSSSLGPTRRRSIYIEDGTDRQDKSLWYVVSVGISGPTTPHRPPTPHFTERDSWTSWVLLVWASGCGDFGFGNAVIV